MGQDSPTPAAPARPSIVFLFSDTGGGHRSAAQAIIEALETAYPGQTRCTLVDFFNDYAPPPLSLVPDIFPPLSRQPWLLGAIFYASDGARRTDLFLKLLWPFIHQCLHRLLAEHPADLYVSVHPLINAPLGQALQAQRMNTPFVTVVTDLVTTHATWFCRRADLITVPTSTARERGIAKGYPARRLRVTGLPISRNFNQLAEDPPETRKQASRARLGWPQEPLAVLLIGGGEGMGPLEPVARAIDQAHLPIFLALVAGRNRALKERLERYAWQTPARIYGFVQDMPDLMAAADILVTKAGPGTVSEGMAAGLPILLYSRLNGSEDGNAGYVVESGAGVWAPNPRHLVAALQRWVSQPEERARAAAASLSQARPDAASDISQILWSISSNEPLPGDP